MQKNIVRSRVYELGECVQKFISEVDIELPKRQKRPATQFGTIVSIAEILANIAVGESFILDAPWMRDYALVYAPRKGIKVTTEKQPDGRFRVWRTE